MGELFRESCDPFTFYSRLGTAFLAWQFLTALLLNWATFHCQLNLSVSWGLPECCLWLRASSQLLNSGLVPQVPC